MPPMATPGDAVKPQTGFCEEPGHLRGGSPDAPPLELPPYPSLRTYMRRRPFGVGTTVVQSHVKVERTSRIAGNQALGRLL
ncbi:hypothetical protein AGR4B_pAt20442 [Agrobacterium tumefaciens str. CFBP 5621]|nr:hypothetical protein AGR4B_pAt20442 [Agrobacterium tumefaciens str. CFBP 5621]